MAKDLDTQQVELIGTAALEAELIRQGFEVARPRRDRGVDLIVYSDAPDRPFAAVPIQVKAASEKTFGVFKKYEKFKNMVMVNIWHAISAKPRFILMTYEEALTFVPDLGGHSWTNNHCYTWSYIPKSLEEKLVRYEDRWDLLRTLLQQETKV